MNRRLWTTALSLAFIWSSVSSFAADPNPPSIQSKRGAWPIRRQWTVAEARHFARWIEHIYAMKTEGALDQQLAKLERILTDPEMNLLLDPEFAGEEANSQLDTETIRAVHRVLDCGKLTVALSAYYAYRRALPWMVSHVRSGDGMDLRTADYTIPAGCASSLDYASAPAFFLDAVTGTSTGNFRVEPGRKGSELSDTVPVAIDRRYLIPGCLFYLDGHVLIVATIDPYGEPHFLDATTAASRDIYTYNGFNAVTGIPPKRSGDPGREYAGCYRGFRAFRFPIAETDDRGTVLRVRRRTDEEMREFGYSTEQYEKMEELIANRQIREAGLALDSFHQFIRVRLRTVERIDLARDIQQFADRMRALLNAREERIQQAWQDVRENGPIPFPEDQESENIFSLNGRWGAGSTALLDARLRATYLDLVNRVDSAMPWFDWRMESVELDGLNPHAIWNHADFAEAVLRAKERVFAATTIEYRNSAGVKVPLSLLDIEPRLNALSFDPNHPPELRWGAAPGSPEAKDAPETPTPLPKGGAMSMAETYRREAYYRSLSQRETDASYLRNMATEGFPSSGKLDDTIAAKWKDLTSPPLVPHGGLAAWLKMQGAGTGD